jgi:hypothetical protein
MCAIRCALWTLSAEEEEEEDIDVDAERGGGGELPLQSKCLFLTRGHVHIG